MLEVSRRQMAAPPYASGLAVFVIVLLTASARAIYVSLYASDIPFWDQWDLLHRTLGPWWSGRWPPLFEPHNEHRIAFTRLISMALLALNGGVFSNLLEAYTNTVIYGSVLALFYALLGRELRERLARVLLLTAVLAIGCLPFDWENTLVGFQNQFYFMAACTMLLAALAAYARPSRRTFWLLAFLGAASLFTMASGLLGPLMVIGLQFLRMWREPARPGPTLAIMVAMALLAVSGFILTPRIAGHAMLEAQGLGEHVRAALTFLIWPLQPLTGRRAMFVLVIWWPLLAWALRFLRTRQSSDGELFAVGILVWVLLQAVAFAHARGHDADGLASRYAGIPSLGLLANLALALLGLERFPTPAWRKAGMALIILSIALVSAVFVRRLPAEVAAMNQRHEFLLIESHYVRTYLRARDPSDLQHPGLMIPFINGDKLREFLNTPEIVNLLPPTLLGESQRSANAHAPHGGWLTRLVSSFQRAVQLAVGHTDAKLVYEPRNALEATPALDGVCFIDGANGMRGASILDLRNGDALQLDGWIINPSVGRSGRFEILLSGTNSFGLASSASGVREDVLKVMHSRREETRGFSTLGILNGMPAGDYSITLATSGETSSAICHPALHIRVH